ncbi:MAG: DUF2914 domain-containing protein [Polyangiaceae bacterium]|nr:DUF2914 domain-containing protein [Polyangiaceae bacterium]
MPHPTLRHLAPLALALALLPACADSPSTTPAPCALDRAAGTGSARAAAPSAPAAATTAALGAASPQATVASPATSTSSRPLPTAASAARAEIDADEPDLDAELGVKRLVVASGVHEREPVGAATRFAEGAAKRVYVFVEVTNHARLASEIEVRFVKEGEPERSGVRLRVGAASRWRTWAYTERARERGRWNVIVYDGDGDVLGRSAFEITTEPADLYPLDPPTAPPTPRA